MRKKPFLQIRNATIGYDKALISEVNISLNLGEICLLVGNNGVGKTTLMKSILGQNSLLSGEILLENTALNALESTKIAKKIAVVFSKTEIPAHFTLWDLVAFGKYIHYPFYFNLSEKDKEQVNAIIKELGLTEYSNLSLSKLSDGNLQKAFIARALVQDSPMIILDEPTTHLDEENKIMILKLLKNLAKRHQKLILFSSHDWRLALHFSDKILWIKDKKLHEAKKNIFGNGLQIKSIDEILNFEEE